MNYIQKGEMVKPAPLNLIICVMRRFSPSGILKRRVQHPPNLLDES